MTTPTLTRVLKRRRCLTDREVAEIAVRVFNGERRSAIAKELGVSGSYLSRLVTDAHRRRLVKIVIADDMRAAVDETKTIGPNGEIYDDVYRAGVAALDDA